MSEILLETIYHVCGLILIYISIKTLMDKDHSSRIGTFIFWACLGTVVGFGKWLPPVISGALVILMCVMVMLKRVKAGNVAKTGESYTKKIADEIGYRIFIPAIAIGLVTICVAIFTKLGALVGLGIGTFLSAIITVLMTGDKTISYLTEGRRTIETVGPISILTMLLATLGTVFSTMGVGDIITEGATKVIPQGNILIGVIVYVVAMALFSMLMGNAFAAFSVITIGIGLPFVIKLGLNPNVIGILGLTSGFCGTLMTPMAANYNVVPVAILEMKDRYGVIKKQIPVAIIMLLFHIILMKIMG
ncbi:MAG: DUF979 domain-containing protein [Tissierellales bacterium]